ncbi:ATP-binding cassette domain-containing protein [Streptococcus oricebi]|uniref:Multidrug ABC transporter ATP-binding protein n=1 Tax=Streptococcus oricebi TaxID=1547447 RepID=A0ABS5B0V5_9STRE|nr:ATP-binding cassette domain-containing protein [Streptococcus oricebi]MBP2622385.1 multidrug ABC transporter ATP-binding protein [Streptococcus oricebi]
MLEIKNLTLTHQKDLKDLVKNLTIVVNAGDKVAIIGEEGNGKSSLLKLMMDEALIHGYIDFEGDIQRDFSTYVYLPQQLPTELEGLSLNDYFFADFEQELDYAKLYRYAQELHFDSQRFTSAQRLADLSGGEKLKVQLIKNLATESEIFFLDEPSNDLDLETLTWLENFIQKTEKTVVFVSHDESLLAHAATKIIHLERIKKKQEARTQVVNLDYHSYQKERRASFDKQEKTAKKEREEHAKSMEKHRRVKQNVEHSLRTTKDSTAGRLLAKKMKAVLSQGKRFEKEAANLTELPIQEEAIALRFAEVEALPLSKRILQLEKEKIEIKGRCLADSIKLSFAGQDKIGIIGQNGVGKSTLLKQMYQKLQGRADIRIGYMPQNYEELLKDDMSPLDFLAPSADKAERELVLSRLASLQFTRDEARHAISHLSGGQKAKLFLLKMVLQKNNLLLLDEPTRNFSPTSQPQVRQLFREYPGALIAVSHDRLFLKEVCQKIYCLSETGLEEVAKEHI